MEKIKNIFIRCLESVRNSVTAFSFILMCLMVFLLSSCKNSLNENSTQNKIESYNATWWYLPMSTGKSGEWGRPVYGVINIDNSKLTLRHAILEGRELGDYRLPYWPITSFVSIFSESAEIAHQSSVSIKDGDKNKTFPFRCGDQKYRGNSMSSKRIDEGFELAHIKDAEILKVTNNGSESPILMEHFFIIKNNDNNIPIYIKATNTTNQEIQDVVVQVSYSQDYTWSSFGVSDSKTYQLIEAPADGNAKSFFAYSSGLRKGFEFHHTDGCNLTYNMNQEYNAWKVLIHNTATTLEPGASIIFSYNLRLINEPLKKITKSKTVLKNDLDKLTFIYVVPKEEKTAPVNINNRITINDMIKDIERPKVRGLHSISGVPDGLTDLVKLKEWEGNLAVVQNGDPIVTRQIVERGHKLGIEMLMPGETSYNTGLPTSFDKFFKSANLRPIENPDSYGQDEDHYYWYPVKPTLDFVTEIGKPMNQATQEDKVIYWSRCFVEKWKNTLTSVREKYPKGNIWFYMPTPSIAHIDPFDYYDQFFSEISKLGDVLTVFPFYYGSDYNQIEYMMRRWKDAGIKRAVFLPGGPTYSKPSQFIRAITAARRGGADGACGFAFSINEEIFDEDWRWKSVMLASQANFPTPDLQAFCFIEEPAKLVEALAVSNVNVISKVPNIGNFIEKFKKSIPGQVQMIKSLPEKPLQDGQLYLIIGDDVTNDQSDWPYNKNQQLLNSNKGVIQMVGNVIKIDGLNATGLQNAMDLFIRFAELVKAENQNQSL